MKRELIKYFKSLGIDVYTNTKARGYQGFFLKNRIDISKNTKEERIIPTLLHEFAHYIHAKLEPDMVRMGGTLEILFGLEERGSKEIVSSEKLVVSSDFIASQRNLTQKTPHSSLLTSNFSTFQPLSFSAIEKELLQVTNFVDKNSHMTKLFEHKAQVKKRIKELETQIKEDYPKFMRSKKFKEFDKYIKKSKAKYLLKYDRVKFVSPHIFKMLRKVEILSIDNLERDFPDMPIAFCAYIRLKSAQKKQARISTRINKLNKYYSKPTELFARLVEGLCLDPEKTCTLAPHSTQRFFKLLEEGYYFELKEVFKTVLEKSNSLYRAWKTNVLEELSPKDIF